MQLPICNNMAGSGGYYVKGNKSRQIKADTARFHLYVESKKQNKQNKRETDRGCRRERVKGSEAGKANQELQTCSYRINKSQG